MKPKLKVLFIAYFFPPVDGGGIPGAMRILKFLRHLDIDSYVLTQNEKSVSRADDSIRSDLPTSRIVRAGTVDPFGFLLKLQYKIKQILRSRKQTAAVSDMEPQKAIFADNTASTKKSGLGQFKDFIYHLNYFPDQASCWILPAFWQGRKVISDREIDVIFATGSPWSSLVLGYLLSKVSRKPLIVDFRDPWINNPFHQTKGEMLDKWAQKLERRIIEHSSCVTLNTEPLRDEFVSRYPEFNSEKFMVLPNGFDNINSDVVYSYDDTAPGLVIRHAGFLYGPRDPSVLLEAINSVNNYVKQVGIKRRWVFEQIGSVNLSFNLSTKFKSMLDDGSFRILEQLPFDHCQHLLASADLLVNVQPGTKTQVPSKIYDYLAVGRPILNITPTNGALGQMAIKYNLGECFDFADRDGLYNYLLERISSTDWVNSEVYSEKEQFSIKRVTQKLQELFEKVM